MMKIMLLLTAFTSAQISFAQQTFSREPFYQVELVHGVKQDQSCGIDGRLSCVTFETLKSKNQADAIEEMKSLCKTEKKTRCSCVTTISKITADGHFELLDTSDRGYQVRVSDLKLVHREYENDSLYSDISVKHIPKFGSCSAFENTEGSSQQPQGVSPSSGEN